jgi:AraC family transcriptional regulator, transcriptional activator of pobA
MDLRASPPPDYLLFGETAEDGPAYFSHIETIAERSALHSWEIAPHRHAHAIQLLLIGGGTVKFQLGDLNGEQAGPSWLVVPSGIVHGFRFSPGTVGHVVTLGLEFARRASPPADPLAHLLTCGGHGCLDAAATATATATAAMLLSLGNVGDPHGPFQATVEALLRSLPIPAGRSDAAIVDARIAAFRQTVERHLAEHRSLDFFACELGISERTLARLCKRHLGCSPNMFINQRLAQEAHRLLCTTNATIADVADQLGFLDVSYFSRFYLRMFGRRPSAERG